MTDRTKRCLLFSLGLFAMTEIRMIGYIGISELFCFFLAPFVFFRTSVLNKSLGFWTYYFFICLWMAFAIVTDAMHHIPLTEHLKGLASIYSLLTVSVCVVPLLVDDVGRVRWFVAGWFLSYILSTVIFQRGSIIEDINLMDAGSGSAMGATMAYKGYWIGLVAKLIGVIVCLYYHRIPVVSSMFLAAGMALYALLSGGRSAFLVGLVSMIMLWIGRRTRAKGYRPRARPLWPLMVIFIILCFAASGVYTLSIRSGWLNDEEQNKYERQTQTGTSPFSLLLSGRGETFIGLFAALDAPFLGHGSKALDWYGYTDAFLEKYGNDLDYRNALDARTQGVWVIPAHSFIISAWLWHGLGGLLFWINMLWIIYKTLKEWIWYAPELWGWMALSIPELCWNILFSPFGSRINLAVLFTCMLLARHITQRVKNGLNGQRKRCELAACR